MNETQELHKRVFDAVEAALTDIGDLALEMRDEGVDIIAAIDAVSAKLLVDSMMQLGATLGRLGAVAGLDESRSTVVQMAVFNHLSRSPTFREVALDGISASPSQDG